MYLGCTYMIFRIPEEIEHLNVGKKALTAVPLYLHSHGKTVKFWPPYLDFVLVCGHPTRDGKTRHWIAAYQRLYSPITGHLTSMN